MIVISTTTVELNININERNIIATGHKHNHY